MQLTHLQKLNRHIPNHIGSKPIFVQSLGNGENTNFSYLSDLFTFLYVPPEMKTQFDHQLKRRLDKEEEDGYASALEANLERLQKDLSVSASTAVTTTGEPHLIKALGEVRAAAQRMR